MLDEVGQLTDQRDFEYLLVESSGISEPIPVTQTFARGFEDASFDPTGIYELDTMVSVVDAHSFWQAFDSGETLTDDEVDPEGNRVPEAALMDQIEFCDVLVLNKCDRRDRLSRLSRCRRWQASAPGGATVAVGDAVSVSTASQPEAGVR